MNSKKGKIYVVGFGTGKKEFMTYQAAEAVKRSDIVIGYKSYIDMLKKIFPNLSYISSSMRKEMERCKMALDEAESGKTVALVSSGDSGVYGMAGIMLQTAQLYNSDTEIEVIPGITALVSAAAVLGTPLMHDFAAVSLSDLMTPLELIYKRIECAAEGDFVIGIYNPKSIKRSEYLNHSADIIMKYRSSDTPVGIVRNSGRDEQSYKITTLGNLKNEYVDMLTIVIVGNSATYVNNNRMITPRGYNVGL